MHKITVLHVPGCAGARTVLEIAQALEQSRDDVEVEGVLIEDEATARKRGFRGSPTVLIDGRDLEIRRQTPIGSMG